MMVNATEDTQLCLTPKKEEHLANKAGIKIKPCPHGLVNICDCLFKK